MRHPKPEHRPSVRPATAKLRRVSATLLAIVCCGAAPPATVLDSWGPFSNKRVVTPSGKRYVVVRKQGQGIRFEYCERRAGAPRLKSAEANPIALALRRAVDIARDPNDRLLAKGTYKQMPMRVLVADGLDGFLLFDKYASVGWGQVVTWVDGKGTVRADRNLKDLFGGAPKGTTATASSMWWSRDVWLDERAKSAVVLTAGGELREVVLADGTVSTPKDSRLLDWCMHGSASGRASALELIAEREVAWCTKAMPLVSGTFLDGSQPRSLRLRAGWILVRAGAPEGVEELYLETVRGAPEVDKEDRQFAVRHLGQVLGKAALPVLRDLMRGTASDVWGDAYHAFVAMGDVAVPALIEMLADENGTSDYRGGAAHALGRIGSLAAVPAIRKAMDCGDGYVEGAAHGALISTFWLTVQAAWKQVPKSVSRDEMGAKVVAPLVKTLRCFELEWAASQLNKRIDHIDDARYSRYLERVRDGVDR